MRSLSRRSAWYPSRQNRLDLEAQLFGDQRLEVTAFATTPYSGTFTMPAYKWWRSSTPIACDVIGFP
jgi:hypothetical protein